MLLRSNLYHYHSVMTEFCLVSRWPHPDDSSSPGSLPHPSAPVPAGAHLEDCGRNGRLYQDEPHRTSGEQCHSPAGLSLPSSRLLKTLHLVRWAARRARREPTLIEVHCKKEREREGEREKEGVLLVYA